MFDSPMTSILLPAREWTQACAEVVAQLDHDDELFIICDAPTDPIASHPLFDAVSKTDEGPIVRLLIAGEPSGCSGKANAIATGIEEASPDQDRFIWTDADFVHGDDWLDRMKTLGERADSAVSGVPVFTSTGWAWRLYEPAAAMFGSLAILAQDGAWGGSVTFTRDHLDLNAFVRDLRRTVSDDGLLWRYLDTENGGVGVTTRRDLVYEIPVEGTPRAVANRLTRNNRILHMTDPSGFRQSLVASLVVLGAGVIAPLYVGTLATLLAGVTYWYLGVRRWTWLFAFPAMYIGLIGLICGVVREEFWWGDRKYRWRSKFDVEVLRSSD